jgi:glycosyltransferase involved in cell wall biosynthesis
MRILYSHRTRSADGQFVHIEALTTALARAGHDVLLCGPEGLWAPGERPRRLDASEGTPPALPRLMHEIGEIAYGGLAAARLLSAARLFQPDVLYERYNLYHHAGQAAARTLRLPRLLEVNAPLVEERTRHGLAGGGGLALPALARRSEDALWRAADAVLPVTSVLARMIEARGVPPERLHVVPNGVDERTLRPGDGQAVRRHYGLEDRFVLGFTGFVRDWHGVDDAVRWLPSKPGAVLLLAGDGPHVAALKALADALDCSDRLVVTGVVQRDEVADHVAAFDVALQPAATPYASPLKLQEYMAQSRAIAAPDQENLREVVADGESAILFPEGGLGAALDRLYADDELRRRLGTAARAALESRDLTWDGNARKVVRIAEALVAERKGVRGMEGVGSKGSDL